MGRFMPAITSMCPASITEMARLEGVPPNMSVSTTTPEPVVDPRDRVDDVAAPLLHIVVGADRDGFEILLRADDVFDGAAEFFGQPAVRYEHQADHASPGFRHHPFTGIH